MAEPLKKNPLNPEPDTPQPFRNQELQENGRSLDTVPAPAELRVETLGSNVVAWRQPSEAANEVAVETEQPFLDSVTDMYRDAQDSLADLVEHGKETAQELSDRARRRVSYWADEYPLQLFAAIAGVGFVAGILLRVWRSNRHE